MPASTKKSVYFIQSYLFLSIKSNTIIRLRIEPNTVDSCHIVLQLAFAPNKQIQSYLYRITASPTRMMAESGSSPSLLCYTIYLQLLL